MPIERPRGFRKFVVMGYSPGGLRLCEPNSQPAFGTADFTDFTDGFGMNYCALRAQKSYTHPFAAGNLDSGKGRSIFAARRESFSEIPALMNAAERLVYLTTQIKEKKTGLPSKRKSLEAYILVAFGRALSAEELEETIQGMIEAAVIKISDTGVVSYG